MWCQNYGRKNIVKNSIVQFTEQEKRVALAYINFNKCGIVARELQISLGTVKFHLENVRFKMKQTKTKKAIYSAIALGLIDHRLDFSN